MSHLSSPCIYFYICVLTCLKYTILETCTFLRTNSFIPLKFEIGEFLCNCHLTTALWIMMNEDTFSKSFSQGDAFSLTRHHWRGSIVGGRWLMSQYKRQGSCWKVHVSSGTLPHAWECMTVNKNSALVEQIINNSQIKTACLVERIHEKSWNDWQALNGIEKMLLIFTF